eukprot:gene12236-32054_t
MWPILQFMSLSKHVGVTHGDARLDNFYFYADESGAKKCGAIDFQLLLKADIASDLVYFVGTSLPEDFTKAHLEELLDVYFDALHAGGGPKIEKKSDDRKEFEENFDFAICFLLTKMVVGAGSIDTSAPRAVEQMDQLLKRMIALYNLRDATAAYVKFRAGKLMQQQGEGNGLSKLGMTPLDLKIADAPVNPIPAW